MTRAHGMDIAKYDYPYKPVKSPPLPVDFLVQRLSYGLMKDEKLAELTPIVLAHPCRGAYHYPSSGVPWKNQADLFLELMGDKYHFWTWDVEKGFNTDSTSFLDGILRSFEYINQYSGRPELLYCSPDTWSTWLAPIQKDLLKYDLWIARWWNDRNMIDPKVPKNMRQDWKFWQYTDNAYGPDYGMTNTLEIDLDLFNGTVAELHAWAKTGVTPTPIPVPVPPSTGAYTYKVNIGGANVRDETGGLITVIYRNTVCTGDGKMLNGRTHILTPVEGWVYSEYLTPTNVQYCPTCGQVLP